MPGVAVFDLMLAFAYFGLSVATLPFLFLSVDTSPWTIRVIMFVRGLFLALTFIPLQTAYYARIIPEQTGRASAIFSTRCQLGAAMGVAILSTVLLSNIPAKFGRSVVPVSQRAGFTSAFHVAFAVAAGFTFLAGLLSLGIHDSDAAATMTPKPA